MQNVLNGGILTRLFETLTAQRISVVSFCRSVRGNISVELALVLPFLLLLVMGAYDFGRGFTEKLRLNNAARAGVQYALAHPQAADNELMNGATQSAQEDAEDGTLAVVPNIYRKCLDDVVVLPTESCSGGEVPMRYIEVDVSKPFELMFDYPMTTGSMTLTGYAELRVR
jgi:Flp pilus assembly protein TadG